MPTSSENVILFLLTQALVLIGGAFGGLLAWPASIGLGRQPTLSVGGILFLCGWLMISYSPQITESRAAFLTILLAGRFITGIASGWVRFSGSVRKLFLTGGGLLKSGGAKLSLIGFVLGKKKRRARPIHK